MKSFDNGIEVLVIKYSLGTAFVVITLVFGFKIVFLLCAVAKAKLALTLASLKGGKLTWLYKLLMKLAQQGAVK